MKTNGVHSVEVKSNFVSTKKGLRLNSAFAFNILVKSIYTNPFQTSIQEYISNARDAHRRIGKDESTIEIDLPTQANPTFTLRDYGCSISPEKMENLVMEVGASDKRGNNLETGGYGIGFKSGFAITDSFLAVVHHEGIQRVYNFHYDESGDAQGDLVAEAPSAEMDGVQISIPIKPEDIKRVKAAAVRAISCWKVRPKVNLLSHQYADVFPDISKDLIYEDEKIVIYSEMHHAHTLANYAGKASLNLMFPVIFDGIPNDPPYPAHREIPGVDRRSYEWLPSYTAGYIFFKASVDDIRQAPNREAFVVDEALSTFYKDRLDHADKVLEGFVTKDIDTSSLAKLQSSIRAKENQFTQHAASKIFRRLNGNWIPETRPRLADRYDIIEIRTGDNGHYNLALSHGILTDTLFPFELFERDKTSVNYGRGWRTKSKKKAPQIFSSLIQLRYNRIVPLVGTNFKPFSYFSAKGELREFPYQLDNNYGNLNLSKYSLKRRLSTGEELEENPVTDDNGDVVDPITPEDRRAFLESVREISTLAAPYYPIVTHVPIENPAEGEPKNKVVHTPITSFDNWHQNQSFIRRRPQTMVVSTDTRFVVSNQKLLEAEGERKYSRRYKLATTYLDHSYIQIDEEWVTPQMKEDLKALFKVTWVSEQELPTPKPREKKLHKDFTFYKMQDTHTHGHYALSLFSRGYEDDEMEDLTDGWIYSQLDGHEGTIYFLTRSEYKALNDCTYLMSKTSESEVNTSYDSRKTQLKEAFAYVKKFVHRHNVHFVVVADKSRKLVNKIMATAKELPDYKDAKLNWLSDEILCNPFDTEETMVKTLEHLLIGLDLNNFGYVEMKEGRIAIALNTISVDMYKEARAHLCAALDATGNSFEEFFQDLTLTPEMAPLVAFKAQSVFLMNPKNISSPSSGTNLVKDNFYLENWFGKFDVKETYDWKVMEAFIKYVQSNFFIYKLFVKHIGADMPLITKNDFKQHVLTKGVSPKEIRAILKEIPKDNFFLSNFDFRHNVSKEQYDKAVSDMKTLLLNQTRAYKFKFKDAKGKEIIQEFNSKELKAILFKTKADQAATEKLILDGLDTLFPEEVYVASELTPEGISAGLEDDDEVEYEEVEYVEDDVEEPEDEDEDEEEDYFGEDGEDEDDEDLIEKEPVVLPDEALEILNTVRD